MRTLIATLTALMLFATLPMGGGGCREEGAAAFLVGDYQKPFQLFEPLAEQRMRGRRACLVRCTPPEASASPKTMPKRFIGSPNATTLLNNSKVATALDELRAKADQYTEITLE